MTTDYEPSSFFAFRTPVLPLDEILAFGTGLRAPSAATADPLRLEAALDDDRALLRTRLRRVLERPTVREAVFVASPSLWGEVDAWQSDPQGSGNRDAERALVRYFLRMAGRPTPFGLFSGSSLGRRGAKNRLLVGPSHERCRHTRLDMHYLCTLVNGLVGQEEIRARLRLCPNSGLYRVADRMRYPERRLLADGVAYHLVNVEVTDYLLATLDRAASGASREELARALAASDADISLDEATAYVDALIEAQILVPDLEPAVTGPEPIHVLIDELQQVGSPAGTTLQRVHERLLALDAGGPGADLEHYRTLRTTIEELPATVDPGRLFQVDLQGGPGAVTLGADVLDEILRGAALMNRLAPATSPDALSRFRAAFRQRYEEREIPLVEVLDEDLGIGFDSEPNRGLREAAPLLRGIGMPLASAGEQVRFSPLHRRLLTRLLAGARAGSREIAFTEEELGELGDPRSRLPSAFHVVAAIAARSAEALERGDFQVSMRWGLGPSGVRMFGRFCHADPELQREVEDHLRAEESLRPGAIFAEIVHLPQGRLGNVLLRPVLRSHEIPFLGRSGAPQDRQLPVTDLVVAVTGDRIVLRSRGLGREILPRMTTAHNYSYLGANLGLYRFLCMLQDQDEKVGIGWDWGPLDAAPFLPRVVCGRLVLHRARWRLGRSEVARLSEAGSAGYAAWQALRAERELPRFLLLAESDNELPVDLDNVLVLESLSDVIRRRGEITLFEMFPGPDELCACGPEGAFVHEVVVPFVRRPPSASPVAEPARVAVTSPAVGRSFIPGSEWLYAKLYCGTGFTDQVLGELVAPFTRQALAAGASDRWFFLRYEDPEPHVRLRLHGEPRRLSGEVLPLLHDLARPLLADGRIWRVQLDTYERELERYGGPEGIEPSERLFHADSEAVLDLLPLTAGDEGAARRWRVALLGLDSLVTDLGFDRGDGPTLIRQLRDSFFEELGLGKPTRIQLGQRFREERARLEALLDRPDGEEHEALQVLRARSARNASIAGELRALASRRRLSGRLEQLAASYLHMHVNRLLRSAQRAQELVLYDFLDRLYTSRAARERSRKPVAGGLGQVVTG